MLSAVLCTTEICCIKGLLGLLSTVDFQTSTDIL